MDGGQRLERSEDQPQVPGPREKTTVEFILAFFQGRKRCTSDVTPPGRLTTSYKKQEAFRALVETGPND